MALFRTSLCRVRYSRIKVYYQYRLLSSNANKQDENNSELVERMYSIMDSMSSSEKAQEFNKKETIDFSHAISRAKPTEVVRTEFIEADSVLRLMEVLEYPDELRAKAVDQMREEGVLSLNEDNLKKVLKYYVLPIIEDADEVVNR